MNREEDDEEERMKKKDPVDVLLKKYSPKVQKLTRSLLRLARKHNPKATEKVYLGWRCVMVSYRGMKHLSCIVSPLKERANIFVRRGPGIKDPKKKIEGISKFMGHIKIRTLKEAKDPYIARLVRASAILARHHSMGASS